jgi:D-alanine-D-alanine ligase
MDNTSVSADRQIAPSDIYERGAVVFPVLHGPQGEDGSIQGFLEILKMPYVGPGILSAAATMDKILSKEVFAQLEIPQVPYVAIYPGMDLDDAMTRINTELRYPLFVKPANMGSSVGISKVNSRAHLQAALDKALEYDSRLVVEEGVVNPHEVECAALGNETVEITFPGEVSNSNPDAFYDYDEKYLNDALTIDVPAKLPTELIAQIRDYAARAYKAVAGRGLSRCDFFVSADGEVFLNEINAIPGFTAFSMYPMLWEKSGVSTTELINRLIALGQAAFDEREQHLSK